MTAFTKVSSNITNAQKQQKEKYDHKHAPNELPVGAEVLLENMKQAAEGRKTLSCLVKSLHHIKTPREKSV